MTLVGKRLVDGWLEATDVFDRHVFRVGTAGLYVFVQRREDLRIQNLEPPNSVHHSFQLLEEKKAFINSLLIIFLNLTTYDAFDVLVFSVDSLNSVNVIAKV